MRLKRIEIENFKGIGARQSIELKPITLLFGPNSAGKSTVLQALHYAREILERQNPDPDQTVAGGLIDLGGFKALVHNHELDRPITIKLVIDLAHNHGSDRLPINSGASLQDPAFGKLDLRYLVGENTDLKDYAVVQEVGISVEVRWSKMLVAPYVSSLSAEMDGEQIASIESPPQEGRALLTNFNFGHPLLKQIVDFDMMNDLEELLQGESFEDEELELDPLSSPLGNEIWELSRVLASPDAKKDFSIEQTDQDNPYVDFPIAVSTVQGALPDFSSELQLDLIDADIEEIKSRHFSGASRSALSFEAMSMAEREIATEQSRRAALSSLLDELILGPFRIARDYLGAMTYIGPLREIPTRNFRPRLSPDDSRWAQGLAAWDMLHNDTKGELTNKVNYWLSDEQRLGTNYRIEKPSFREIPVPSRLSTLFERGLTEDDLGELQELFEALELRSEIALRDFTKGILVAPSDVGVGISQMIPVIVGCLCDRVGLLAVEQPELHIHPAVQVAMGDLLIASTEEADFAPHAQKSLLIETHSEHIMLRLLRRIRETAENELPPAAPELTTDRLSVIYVETSGGGINFRPLRVDDDGEFIDRWPSGFFDERAEELF